MKDNLLLILPVILIAPFTFQSPVSDGKHLSIQQDSRGLFVCISGLLHVTSMSFKFGVMDSGETAIVFVALYITV